MATKPEVTESEPVFGIAKDLVELRTDRRRQFIDVTELVAERVRRSGVRDGVACVQTLHTTTALLVNENEPLLLEDVARLLDRLAPEDVRYAHDDLDRRRVGPRAVALPADEPENGEAHCKAVVLPASAALTIADGRLLLGRWQSVFLVELDGPRNRTLSIVVLGVRRP
ncbi:MAG: YjbQ family protein [Acidobacteria bacterium]|nr:YjbQ family protein [Acidobacteriota bacterium]